jgi:hypothetical protein
MEASDRAQEGGEPVQIGHACNTCERLRTLELENLALKEKLILNGVAVDLSESYLKLMWNKLTQTVAFVLYLADKDS